jgi:hypothetical protein
MCAAGLQTGSRDERGGRIGGGIEEMFALRILLYLWRAIGVVTLTLLAARFWRYRTSVPSMFMNFPMEWKTLNGKHAK